MKRKNIIITGASSGLGMEMARAFAIKGANLGLCARRLDQLEELKRQLSEIAPAISIMIQPLDVNDHAEVFSTFDHFKEQMGTIDRVIVNAGIGLGGTIGKGRFEANKATFNTNVIGALAQCEAAMAIFRDQDFGHLVTISSVSALRGLRGSMACYAASKSAVSSFTEAMYLDTLNKPIKVTCIHPGFIHTDMNKGNNNMPFAVDLDTGVKSMVKAIEREKRIAYCPERWAFFSKLLPLMPIKLLQKL